MSRIEIAHIHLETKLVLSEDRVTELIVESPGEFYAMVDELKKLFAGEEGRFVFAENGELFSPASAGGIGVQCIRCGIGR